MKSQQQIVKIDSEVWVTRLPSISHPPLSMRRHRVTHLPPKNVRAPWGCAGARWSAIIVWQVSYVQYLLACQKLQRSMLYNMAKSYLTWSRIFHRRHLGRRVTAVTRLRWPTVPRLFKRHDFEFSIMTYVTLLLMESKMHVLKESYY